MSPEPEAGAAPSEVVDTASAASDALTQSEPTSEGAPGAERQTPQEPPSDSSSTPEDSSEEDPDDAPRTDEERKLSRKERQKLREDERITKAVEERISRAEADRKQADEARERQAQLEAAAKARAERFEKYLGTAESNQWLQSEIDGLVSQMAALTADEYHDPTASKALSDQLVAKRADLIRRYENNQMAEEIRLDLWSRFENDFSSAGSFPELAADAAAKARYLRAEGGVAGALKTLRETLVTATEARKDAEIAEIRKTSKAEIEAMRADRDAWRTRAGGEALADVGGGAPSAVPGVLTPERYHGMSFEQRQELRATPEGRARIDAMTRRSGAA